MDEETLKKQVDEFVAKLLSQKQDDRDKPMLQTYMRRAILEWMNEQTQQPEPPDDDDE